MRPGNYLLTGNLVAAILIIIAALMFAGSALAEKASSCVGFREFGSSDHGPVQAVFEVEAPQYEGAPEPEIAPPPPAPPGQLPLL